MATCGKCKATGVTVASIKACYAGQAHGDGVYVPTMPLPAMGNVAKVTANASTASEKQQAFIVKLWGERYPDTSAEALAVVAVAAGKLTKAEASEQITQLLALPNAAKAKAAATPATGYIAEAKKGDVHFVNGEYYRIHVGQHSGKPYACKALVITAAIWDEQGTLVQPGKVRWDIAKGFIHKLSEATKTTPEQAAAFGKLVGRCCFCSHAIDTPESTAVGYGPICAGKYGLPWGDTTTAVMASA